jgi:hypothetical protein
VCKRKSSGELWIPRQESFMRRVLSAVVYLACFIGRGYLAMGLSRIYIVSLIEFVDVTEGD